MDSDVDDYASFMELKFENFKDNRNQYIKDVLNFYISLFNLDIDLPPNFFSGDPVKRKLIFILKNPMLRSMADKSKMIKKFNLFKEYKLFLDDQNNKLITFNKRSPFFIHCDIFTEVFIAILKHKNHYLAKYLEENSLTDTIAKQSKYYKNAAKYSAIIDLIPFYSQNFNVGLSERGYKITEIYFERILNYIRKNAGKNEYIIINANSFLNQFILYENDKKGITKYFEELQFHKIELNKVKGSIWKFDTGDKNIKFFSVSNWARVGKGYELVKEYANWAFNNLN